MAPILGYWDIRGFAQSIRLMLAYAEKEYEDKSYSVGPAPDYDRSSWLNEKFTLGLDFPNLPYYIDGDVKITQSIAIMRYLARELELEPVSEEDKLKSDVIEQQAVDFRTGFVRLAYNPDFEKLKDDYLKTLPDQLKLFDRFLEDTNWFGGETITHVDFLMYEALDIHRELSADVLKNFPTLADFMDRFEQLPTIKNYMKSDKFMKWPITSDMAAFGSRPSRKSK